MGEIDLASFKQLLDKITVENIKIELMKTAYGNEKTFLNRLDPRIAIFWYLMFALIPWFTWNTTTLLGLLAITAVMTAISRVSPLILFFLCFGLVSNAGYIVFVAFLFGGNMDAVIALSIFTLKLTIISLASIAVFTSMDPEKFSDALLSFRLPKQLCFGISYGYRMLPILIEEYNNIFNSFRLRGKSPEKSGFLAWRSVAYLCKIAVFAFYPMMLNTAKRTRTTVESLEVKGFTYSGFDRAARELQLAYLKVRTKDVLFLVATIGLVAGMFYVGHLFPIERTVAQFD